MLLNVTHAELERVRCSDLLGRELDVKKHALLKFLIAATTELNLRTETRALPTSRVQNQLQMRKRGDAERS